MIAERPLDPPACTWASLTWEFHKDCYQALYHNIFSPKPYIIIATIIINIIIDIGMSRLMEVTNTKIFIVTTKVAMWPSHPESSSDSPSQTPTCSSPPRSRRRWPNVEDSSHWQPLTRNLSRLLSTNSHYNVSLSLKQNAAKMDLRCNKSWKIVSNRTQNIPLIPQIKKLITEYICSIMQPQKEYKVIHYERKHHRTLLIFHYAQLCASYVVGPSHSRAWSSPVLARTRRGRIAQSTENLINTRGRKKRSYNTINIEITGEINTHEKVTVPQST